MLIGVVVGTRPEFIKTWSVIKAINSRNDLDVILIHTGQHYDYELSQAFFEDLSIQKPNYYLDIGQSTPLNQISKIIDRFDDVFKKENLDAILVQGDTNSAMAAALTSVKNNIPVGHIEAGCRSFDKTMPEEINRILIDSMSSLLFAPSDVAYLNLMREGADPSRTKIVGNTAADTIHEGLRLIKANNIQFEKPFCVATIHRANNTDDSKRLSEILSSLNNLPYTCYFPMHPRTKKRMDQFNIQDILNPEKVKILQPLKYLEFLKLMKHSECIITDSGGIQEEASILGIPTLTIRDNTEWPETVWHGMNRLVAANAELIQHASNHLETKKSMSINELQSKTGAGSHIVDEIVNHYKANSLKFQSFDMISKGYPFPKLVHQSVPESYMFFEDNGDITINEQGKQSLAISYRALDPESEK